MPRSSSTRYSHGSCRTTSDVLDVLQQEDTGKKKLSLRDTRKKIKDITGKDTSLAAQTISEIQSIKEIFSSISSIPERMVNLMHRTNTYLAGLQATSYFYPVSGITDAPWDLFCSSIHGDPDTLLAELSVLTGAEVIENLQSSNGSKRMVIYRRSVNGTTEPVTIRVFVSTCHPLEAILDLRLTQQQSFVSAVAAVCFWPKLLQSKQRKSKQFDNNNGLSIYPTGEAKFRNRHSKLYPLSNPIASSLQIHVGLLETEYIMFENEGNIPRDKFSTSVAELRNIVYAVSNLSTKYMGNVSGM